MIGCFLTYQIQGVIFFGVHIAVQIVLVTKKKGIAMKIITAVVAATMAVLLFVANANAGLIFYSDRATFEAASGLSGIDEDFEEANVTPFGVVSTTDPLSASTNDGVFSTADIAAGLTISSSSGNGVVALGAGTVTSTKAIAANFFADSNILSFGPSVTAIGLDLFSSGFGGDTLNLSIFDGVNALMGSTSVAGVGTAGTFFGVISDMGPIAKIDINSQSGAGEIMDNITFGAVRVPEPGTVALLLLGLAGLRLRARTV